MRFQNIGNLLARRWSTGVVHERIIRYSEQCGRKARLLADVTARWLLLVTQGVVLGICTTVLVETRSVLLILDRTSPLSRNSRTVPLLNLPFRRVTTTTMTQARKVATQARQLTTTQALSKTTQVRRLRTTSLLSHPEIPHAKTWHRQNGVRKLSLDRPATLLLPHLPMTILDTMLLEW
jgi:hypothetical protein